MKITKFKNIYKDYYPVGKGWKEIVDKLVDDIIAIDDTVIITDTKEKFGGLRFYILSGNEQIFDLISEAEDESYKTCESCGTKKDVTTEGGWLKTLCKKCRGDKNACNA